MLFFKNDYSEGAHEKVLARLIETNMEKQIGYGEDAYCASAREKIRAACGCPDAEVFFLVGGTQTNKTVIATMLRPYEGAVSADTGHINGHEAGAVEYTGHKILPIPHVDGKIPAAALKSYLEGFYATESHDHMVFPGMVYISHPTEYGTLYTKEELTALRAICDEYALPLFMDGARLGYGLVSTGTDVTLRDIAALCDVFYIGGTKCGALCGEAVVFTKHNAPRQFMTMVKQHGAMLAKGRLLGVQFDALFTDDLYRQIGRIAIQTADALRAGFVAKGYALHIPNPTNQIFVVMGNDTIRRLRQHAVFELWEPVDDTRSVVRFVTSWATTMADVEKMIELL